LILHELFQAPPGEAGIWNGGSSSKHKKQPARLAAAFWQGTRHAGQSFNEKRGTGSMLGSEKRPAARRRNPANLPPRADRSNMMLLLFRRG
jgi:hypothetical protein